MLSRIGHTLIFALALLYRARCCVGWHDYMYVCDGIHRTCFFCGRMEHYCSTRRGRPLYRRVRQSRSTPQPTRSQS